MRYWRTFKSKLYRLFKREPKCYTSIDKLPCGLWHAVTEKSNTTMLRVDPSRRGEDDTYYTIDCWRDIQDQITLKFGFSQDYKERLIKLRKIALLKIEAELSGQRHKYILANALQAEIDAETNAANSFNFTESVAILEKELGFAIDTDTFPTSKYLQHIHLMNKTLKNG